MRLLVVKLSRLRGALATTAALRALRERQPNLQVTFVTQSGSEPALEGCPAIVDIVGLESGTAGWSLLAHLRRQRFDAAIALGQDAASQRLVAWSGARLKAAAGKVVWWLRPYFHQAVDLRGLDPHEAARDHEVLSRVFHFKGELLTMWFASSRMQDHGLFLDERRFAVIHPGSRHPDRLLEIDKWAAVARGLLASGEIQRVIISAGPDDQEKILAEALAQLIGPEAMSTAGRLRWAQTADLLKKSRIFLGVDSSILQLAAAVGAPVVGVFGSSDYARARPWGTLNRVVRIDTTPFEGEAKTDYRERMNRAWSRITPRQILQAAEELLRLSP
jgi:ADP-heptose:LPS heptosyltransferase